MQQTRPYFLPERPIRAKEFHVSGRKATGSFYLDLREKLYIAFKTGHRKLPDALVPLYRKRLAHFAMLRRIVRYVVLGLIVAAILLTMSGCQWTTTTTFISGTCGNPGWTFHRDSTSGKMWCTAPDSMVAQVAP